MKRTRAITASVVTALLVSMSSVFAQPVFLNVSDSGSDELFDYVGPPSIGNEGTIAFLANIEPGGQFARKALFAIQDGELHRVAAEASFRQPLTNEIHNTIGPFSLSNSGVVAISTDRGIFWSAEGLDHLIPLVDSESGFSRSQSSVSINGEGLVTFWGGPEDGLPGIFLVSSGTVNRLTRLDGFDPHINEQGVVLYFGAIGRLFTQTVDGPATDVLGQRIQSGHSAVINDHGVIAYAGESVVDSKDGIVLIHSDGSIKTLAPSIDTGFFFQPNPVALNNDGVVAVMGGYPNVFAPQKLGIYVGMNPEENLIIEASDVLFGSIVTDLQIGRESLSDTNMLAFRYKLLDGRHGVAVVDISSTLSTPENVATPGETNYEGDTIDTEQDEGGREPITPSAAPCGDGVALAGLFMLAGLCGIARIQPQSPFFCPVANGHIGVTS